MPNNGGHWQDIESILKMSVKNIDSELMEEFAELHAQLEALESKPSDELTQTQTVFVNHWIRTCRAYLEALLEEERQRFITENVHQQTVGLKRQLQHSLSIIKQYDDKSDIADTSDLEHCQDCSTSCLSNDQPEQIPSASEPASHLASLADQTQETAPANTLEIYALGAFRAFFNGTEIKTWPKGKGKQIFKYLLVHGSIPVPKEVLMETFWQDHDSDSARNNLNVAIYSLRQSLKTYSGDMSPVIFDQGCYTINHEIRLNKDFEKFEKLYQSSGRHSLHTRTTANIAELELAESMYHGDFFAEDYYTEWLSEDRENLKTHYIDILKQLEQHHFENQDCEARIEMNKKIIAADPCDEDAHQHLIEIYQKSGQRHLALKQFNSCKTSLQKELDLDPSDRIYELMNQMQGAVVA